jgi:hypothetical protein
VKISKTPKNCTFARTVPLPLVYLKDLTELTYTEIVKLAIFSDLQRSSLAPIYRNTKKRLSAEKQN